MPIDPHAPVPERTHLYTLDVAARPDLDTIGDVVTAEGGRIMALNADGAKGQVVFRGTPEVGRTVANAVAARFDSKVSLGTGMGLHHHVFLVVAAPSSLTAPVER